jgi:hypothetical protein
MKEEQKVHQFVQTYSLSKGLKMFGSQGRQAAVDEMKQIQDWVVFQ